MSVIILKGLRDVTIHIISNKEDVRIAGIQNTFIKVCCVL